MISLLFGFIIGIAFVIFALQNTAIVALSFLGWKFESPLALVALLVFAAGIALSAAVSIPSVIRDSLRIRRLEKENGVLRNERDELATALETYNPVVVTAPHLAQR